MPSVSALLALIVPSEIIATWLSCHCSCEQFPRSASVEKMRIIWWLRNFEEDLLDRFLHSEFGVEIDLDIRDFRVVRRQLFRSQKLETTNSPNPLKLSAKLLWILHESPVSSVYFPKRSPNQCLMSLHGLASTKFVLLQPAYAPAACKSPSRKWTR